MYGFSQRQGSKKKKDEEKRKAAAQSASQSDGDNAVPRVVPPRARAATQAPAQPSTAPAPTPPKSDFYTNASGNTGSGRMPAGSKEVSANTRPQRTPTADFYTNKEGQTGARARPSSSRAVATTTPQKGGFPANPKPAQLPPPAGSGSQGNPDFYTNKAGQTTQGFATSSSRAITPVQETTGRAVATTNQPGEAGQRASSGTAREPRTPDYETRAKSKARAARDTAQYESERAAQDKRFRDAGKSEPKPSEKSSPKKSPAKSPAGFRQRMPSKFGIAGPIGAVTTGIPEARDVARVAQDEDSSGLDVANQVAEGTGRTAATLAGGAMGAKGGAAVGALGGPLAPITVPVGSFIGGAGGAALGWWGADQAIEKGRELTGTDPSSPVDRVSDPAQTAPVQQPQAQPQQPENESFGTLQPMPEQQAIPERSAPQNAGNNVTFDPETNSFSGGVVGRGYTVNGEPAGGPNIADPQSDQNREAIENLMARTPEFGGGFQSPRDNRPNFHIGQDSSVQERAERAALNAASTAYDGAQNGQLTANQLRTLRGIASDRRSDATKRQTSQAGNETQLATAQMREQGQNQRAGARLSVDQSRLEGEQQERGFRVRQAQQIESLRNQYQTAETDEERAAIQEQLRILNGDDKQQQGGYKAQMVKVPIDPASPELGMREVPYTFNEQTGTWTRAEAGAPTPGPQPNQNHINALRNNPSLAAQFDEIYGEGAAAQYTGAI